NLHPTRPRQSQRFWRSARLCTRVSRPGEVCRSAEARAPGRVAALNAAYSAHRDRLSPTLPAIIKHGLKADREDDDDAVSVARENQILTDSAIAALIRAAREVDHEQEWHGDLFRL